MFVKFVNYIDQINQFRRTKVSNRNFLIICALVVGIIAGLAASLLKGLTHYIEHFLQAEFQKMVLLLVLRCSLQFFLLSRNDQ